MKKLTWISSTMLAGCLAATFPLHAQSGVQTQTVVTVMPKSGTEVPIIAQTAVQASIEGKQSKITNWVPLRREQAGLQIVILIDNSARSGVSLQFNDLRNFIQHLPDGAQVGVAYMQNGNAVMAQNITADRNLASQAFRLPSGPAGSNGSPYFCLSSLVKNWPSGATNDRREVLMITDGVDLYGGRRFDPGNPYVRAAIMDAQKAGVIVDSIFYRDAGRAGSGQAAGGGGQSYLLQVAQGTGGRAYWVGFGNPVSFVPFLDDLHTRLENQYELGLLASPKNKSQLQPLKVKVSTPGVKVDAPTAVLVPGSEPGR
jgi:hypothetical protein